MRTLLSLDLSTTCSGFAKLDMDTKALITYGVLKPNFKNPKRKGISQFMYPQIQLFKMRELAQQVIDLIDPTVEKIVIEEINRGKNRLGQKVLDGFHFIVLDRMKESDLFKVQYFDSDGKDGWRSAKGLALQLSDLDKMINKERRTFNKKLGKETREMPVITQKTLACRFVNKQFGLHLDDDSDSSHADIADAIGLGWFYLTKVLK